jgi:hypothetical protein
MALTSIIIIDKEAMAETSLTPDYKWRISVYITV